MTNKTWTWIAVVGLFLIGALVGWQLTNVFTPKPPQIKHDTIRTPFDTTAYKKTLKPVLITNWKDTGSIKWKDYIVTVPFQVPFTYEDSVKILQAYFQNYDDTTTVVNDENLYFFLRYGITQNKLISAEGKYFIKKSQIVVNNNPLPSPASMMFIGAQISAFKDGFGLGGRITYKSKKDQLWHVGVDYMPYILKKPIYSVGTDIKIKL